MIQKIEGVYKEQFQNATVQGKKYQSENVLELVRVSKASLYFNLHLEFSNAHECNLFGLAKFAKSRQFVYQNDEAEDEHPCVFTIGLSESDVLLDDVRGTCQTFCGGRGSLSNIRMPLSEKRVIKYMDRLKKSKYYKESTSQP